MLASILILDSLDLKLAELVRKLNSNFWRAALILSPSLEGTLASNSFKISRAWRSWASSLRMRCVGAWEPLRKSKEQSEIRQNSAMGVLWCSRMLTIFRLPARAAWLLSVAFSLSQAAFIAGPWRSFVVLISSSSRYLSTRHSFFLLLDHPTCLFG